MLLRSNGALLFFPNKELASRRIAESGFHDLNERLVVDFVKCQSKRKAGGGDNQKYRKKERQNRVKKKTQTSPSGEVDELLEGQRPEYLVFYFNELRYLELNTNIVTLQPTTDNILRRANLLLEPA